MLLTKFIELYTQTRWMLLYVNYNPTSKKRDQLKHKININICTLLEKREQKYKRK